MLTKLGIESLLWYITIPFTVLFIIQLIVTFLGLGDSDIDFDDDTDFQSSFRFFTIKNFIIFFTVFGWAGLTFLNLGLSNGLVLFLASLAGILVMFLISLLFYFILKLTSDGTIDLKNALNLTGRVYIPIPAKRKGTGKVQITIQDSLKEIEAITDGERLKTGSLVKVIDIYENLLVVKKTD